MIKAYLADDSAGFTAASHDVRSSVESAAPHWDASASGKIEAETLFNQFRPLLWAWIFYLLAALLWTATLWSADLGKLKPLALGATGVAAFAHVAGMGLRCYVAGRPPVTNMYESVIWVSFGQLVFASILYWRQKQPIVLAVSATLATLGLIAGDAAPAILDPSIQPLVPVLRSNYWLTIHVLTITLGYAAFALTLGLANVTLFNFLKIGPGVRARIQTLNQLTYRAMQFGVVLIAAGTILGGIWADYSWGRFWGWGPQGSLGADRAPLLHHHPPYPLHRMDPAVRIRGVDGDRVPFGVDGLVRGQLRPRRWPAFLRVFPPGGAARWATFVAVQLAYVGFVAVNAQAPGNRGAGLGFFRYGGGIAIFYLRPGGWTRSI